MYNFNYHKPKTVDQAVELMNSCDDPKILSGGHTMVPTLKQRLAQPSDRRYKQYRRSIQYISRREWF
jgi:aerobic carbon-monoxide dehydrogenase medium subunit